MNRMTLGRLTAFALIVAALDSSAKAETSQTAQSTSPLSPIVVSLVPQETIVPVLGSDGRYHLLYELQMVNTLGGPADLRAVEVLDTGNGKALLTLSAADIIEGDYLHTLDRQTATTTSFASFEGRVLILNLSFDSKGSIPHGLTHRFEVSGPDPFNQQPTLFDYDGGAVSVSRREPPVLLPPLEGGGWLASDGCCGPTGHINALIGLNGKLQGAERFAIDWIKIDADGRIFTGDKTDPSNWAGYGSKVLAVGSGVVTEARDDQQDQMPGKMPTDLPFAQIPGNHVVIGMEGGISAVYAHLKPGSIRVKVGNKVRAGDVIGQLGNTGASLAPHLHFHIVNGPNVITSDGYPYVIKSFGLAATSEVSDLLKVMQGEADFPHRDQMNPVEHKLQLPLGFTIIDFPGGE
jgi:murein DD-endopeptidase MepM/ murein hydrolase activator NlpD